MSSPISSFQDLALIPKLQQSLIALGLTAPTPVQAATIPLALAGHDILATAQTGSGKTFAFLIPLISFINNNPHKSGLILVPTRELGTQVQDAVRSLTQNMGSMPTALLIGGDSMGKQFTQLRKRPRIIIGTPGRIHDHLRRESLILDLSAFLVFDEVDRMLDMGFKPQIEEILEYVPEERQTLMFSATLPSSIEKLAATYQKDAQIIKLAPTSRTAASVEQIIWETKPNEKMAALCQFLDENEDAQSIIFATTKRSVDKVTEELKKLGYEASAIHGDFPQRQRDRVMRAFKDQSLQILVATDVASRGLDIPALPLVINYELPPNPEDYVHRIGRTGRADLKGKAVSIIGPKDKRLWSIIERFLAGKQSEFDSSPRGGKRSTSRGGDRFGKKPSFSRSPKPQSDRRFSKSRDFEEDRPPRKEFSDRSTKSSRTPAAFGDRPLRERAGADRPRAKRDGIEKPYRNEQSRFSRDQRPERPENPKPFRKALAEDARNPEKSFRKPRNLDNEAPKRSFSDERPYTDAPKKNFGAKKPFGDKKPFARKSWSDESSKPVGDRPNFKKKFERDSKRPRTERPRSDAAKKSFGPKKSFGGPKKAFGGPVSRPKKAKS